MPWDFWKMKAVELWITKVILRPKIVSSADAATLEQVHHLAHEACFIANSGERLEPIEKFW